MQLDKPEATSTWWDAAGDYARLVRLEAAYFAGQWQASLVLALVGLLGAACAFVWANVAAAYGLWRAGLSIGWVGFLMCVIYAAATYAAFWQMRRRRRRGTALREIFDGSLKEGRNALSWIAKRFI